MNPRPNVLGDVFRLSNLCLKHVHMLNLKRILKGKFDRVKMTHLSINLLTINLFISKIHLLKLLRLKNFVHFRPFCNLCLHIPRADTDSNFNINISIVNGMKFCVG